MNQFLSWCITQNIDPEEITYNQVLRFIDHERKRGIENQSIIRLINSIRIYYDYLVDTGLIFDQVINGEIQWSFHPASGPTGFGRLSTTPGRIASIDSPTLTLPTGQGVLHFKVADNKLLCGTLGLPLPGNGEINGNFRLHDLISRP